MIDKIVLFPYYLTLKIRHAMYDHGFIKKRHHVDVPTVCLGNVTVGGTGKTPHTELILRTLLESEVWGAKSLAVLSRGYKRSSKGFQQVPVDGSAKVYGDEPLQIKKKFPVVTVAVDKDRIEGCNFLSHPETLHSSKKGRKCIDKDVQKADLVLLDDAFQYRRLQADVNIVLVDYNRPTFKDMLLPMGSLRDLPERIQKADIIIVSKCPHYLSDWEKSSFVDALGLKNYSAEKCTAENKKHVTQGVFFTTIDYQQPLPVFPTADPRYVYSKKLILFSGIADDTTLRCFLSDKYRIIKRFSFPDHHTYSKGDVKSIASFSKVNSIAAVATTEKDAQRVLDCTNVPNHLQERLFYVPIQVGFLSDEDKEMFRTMLISLIP